MTRARKNVAETIPDQSKKFIEAARELGCDDDPAHFDEVLKKVARHKPDGGEPAKPAPRSAPSKEQK